MSHDDDILKIWSHIVRIWQTLIGLTVAIVLIGIAVLLLLGGCATRYQPPGGGLYMAVKHMEEQRGKQ